MDKFVKGRMPKFPFRNCEHARVHAQAYLKGSYSGVRIVSANDLKREAWLEHEMPARRSGGILDREAVEAIFRWKMSSTLRSERVPASVLASDFVSATSAVLSASGRAELADAIPGLIVPGVRIVAASAFLYWLRPTELAVLDRKATEALDLPSSTDHPYSVEEYLDYSEACAEMARTHGLSVRDLDRALFVFLTLLKRSMAIP